MLTPVLIECLHTTLRRSSLLGMLRARLAKFLARPCCIVQNVCTGSIEAGRGIDSLVVGLVIKVGMYSGSPCTPSAAGIHAAQERSSMARRTLLLCGLLVSLIVLTSAQVFTSDLDAQNQTPPISGVDGSGQCSTFEINATTWGYNVTLLDLQDVTLAHFHYGNATTSGPVVVPLLSLTVPLTISGEAIFQHTFTTANFSGPLAGKGFTDLKKAVSQDLIYCNVHTTQYPEGIIRGQLT